MQLRQEYIINNTTFKNELFISEKDNVNIYSLMINFFLNCSVVLPVNAKNSEEENKETACSEEKADIQENSTAVNVPVEHEEKEAKVNLNIINTETKCMLAADWSENKLTAHSEEKADIQENSPAVNVPVEHEEKETKVKVNANKKETDKTDTPGFYLHLVLGENNIEKWGPWKSKKAAKQALYDMVYRRKKQTGYDVKYSVIDIIPMTKKEFDNRNK